MPYYELIYESGLTSVAECESDEEALEGAKAQHEKATKGVAGGPSGDRAERVVRVLKYDVHPDSFNVDETMSADVLTKECTEAIKVLAGKDGVVHIPLLIQHLRGLSDPLVSGNAHDSQYKMKETKELELKWQ